MALVVSSSVLSGVAQAEEVPPSQVQGGVADERGEGELSEGELAELERDVEVLFTRYLPMDKKGQFALNELALREDGKEGEAAQLEALVEVLNSESQPKDGPSAQPYGAGEFAVCVALNGLGIPAIGAYPGLKEAIKEGIRAWNWKLTAKTVARIVGPQVVKALGGPVGIGVALSWAAVSCRDQL